MGRSTVIFTGRRPFAAHVTLVRHSEGAVEQFVSALENLPRSMRITSLSLAPGANPLKPLAQGSNPAANDASSLRSLLTLRPLTNCGSYQGDGAAEAPGSGTPPTADSASRSLVCRSSSQLR